MPHAVRMPKPGQMTEECVLTLWLKAEGEAVTKGDVLFEIETDKSTMEVESFHDGILLQRLVAEGETVPVNAICAWIGAQGEALPETEDPPETAPATLPEPESGSESGPEPGRKPALVNAAAPARGSMVARPAISPRARAKAAAAGIDVASMEGTGPGHRIVERDVLAAIAAAGRSAGPLPDSDPGEEPPRPLSRIRQVIAERLTLSATTIPSFSVTVAADVTRLLVLRDELRAGGTRLTLTDFVLAATAQTLVEFPDVNSRTDGRSVWIRRRVHLGLAVALPTGLIVAVIRDADRLGLLEIHERATALAAAARDGSLSVDDMVGSTFTVSNLGMLGVDSFSAMINPGESAILAVGAAIPSAVVVADGIAVRTIMKLTLSADHRLIDGELGARFANAIRRRLEDPTDLRRGLTSA